MLGFTFLPSFGSEDGVQVWVTVFTVSQPLAQVFCELPGSNQPLSYSQCESISASEPKTSGVYSTPLLLSL